MMNYRIICVLFLIFSVTGSFQKSNTLKVSVYYESLCPDSIAFITNQFYPTLKQIGNVLDPRLIPFGKATITNSTDGHIEFQCQHGAKECHGNKVQSCVIALFPSGTSAQFVDCAMGSTDPSDNIFLMKCANTSNIPWTSIKQCLESGQADKLLAENGRLTHLVTPKITFIPTIAFNDVYDPSIQDLVFAKFLKVVCELLKSKPTICNSVDVSINLI